MTSASGGQRSIQLSYASLLILPLFSRAKVLSDWLLSFVQNRAGYLIGYASENFADPSAI